MRRLAARAALAIGSLLLSLLLLEAGFRAGEAWRGRHEVKWAVYDPELGYRLNPAWTDISEQGLRDHPVGTKEPGGRILILGDSVAFNGDSIDDTWPAYLRAHLRERGHRDVGVVNAAVRGYTTHQELLYLRRDGLTLAPDLVGVGFVLNDLHDFLTVFRVENEEIVSTDYEFTTEAAQQVASPLYRTLRRSRLLVFLRRRLAVAIDTIWLSFDREGYSFEARPDFLTAWRDEPWQRLEQRLAEMHELGDENGFRLFVQVAPFGEQYRQDYLERDRDHVLLPQRRLAGICERQGIALLDLYPHLDPERHLERDGIHLTAAGRRRVGELTAEFLIEQGLLPGAPDTP